MEKIIYELIAKQIEYAKEKHGEKFRNLDEFDGAIHEEFEEVTEELEIVVGFYEKMHYHKRTNEIDKVKEYASKISREIVPLIEEMSQIAAVCDKLLEGLENE